MIEDLIEFIKKVFIFAFIAMYLLGNLVWILIVHAIAAIGIWDVPEVEKALRPWDFETTYEYAERTGRYVNPISMFIYDPEKYPDIARKIAEQEHLDALRDYDPTWSDGPPPRGWSPDVEY
ncbi:hypothetical protein N9L71_01210 [Verrucomicrobiales bacterium]|jgi:hypothetical protein|nr:hypothetical protein [Verrucomicrobiales bacterium]